MWRFINVKVLMNKWSNTMYTKYCKKYYKSNYDRKLQQIMTNTNPDQFLIDFYTVMGDNLSTAVRACAMYIYKDLRKQEWDCGFTLDRKNAIRFD
jgi:hypothetical protein